MPVFCVVSLLPTMSSIRPAVFGKIVHFVELYRIALRVQHAAQCQRHPADPSAGIEAHELGGVPQCATSTSPTRRPRLFFGQQEKVCPDTGFSAGYFWSCLSSVAARQQ